MIKSIYKTGFYFLFCVAPQVLILDNIHLFRIATPLLYLYVIVKIPANISRSPTILISFFLGLVMDIFSNTLGMHTAACTLAGMFREPIMYAFSGKELLEESSPSYRTLGINGFIKYVSLIVAIHHIALFSIESISFFDPVFLLLRIIASVILTMLLIFIVEAFNFERKSGES
jgi:rod shape-determining protein MreD